MKQNTLFSLSSSNNFSNNPTNRFKTDTEKKKKQRKESMLKCMVFTRSVRKISKEIKQYVEPMNEIKWRILYSREWIEIGRHVLQIFQR